MGIVEHDIIGDPDREGCLADAASSSQGRNRLGAQPFYQSAFQRLFFRLTTMEVSDELVVTGVNSPEVPDTAEGVYDDVQVSCWPTRAMTPMLSEQTCGRTASFPSSRAGPIAKPPMPNSVIGTAISLKTISAVIRQAGNVPAVNDFRISGMRRVRRLARVELFSEDCVW